MDYDIQAIYEHLHDRYPVVLSSSQSLGYKSEIDFPVLHGHTILGYFELYYDDISFAFYAMHENKDVFAHFHLETLSDAEKAIANFMDGKLP